MQDRKPIFLALIDLDVGALNGRGGADLGKGAGLRNLLGLGNADRQAALGNGDGADTHVIAHHDDARLFVDDHPGQLIGLDPQLFQIGPKVDDVIFVAFGNLQNNGGRIARGRRQGAEKGVDGLGNSPGGGEIRIAQRQLDAIFFAEFIPDFPLDDGPAGDAAAGGNALGDRFRLAAGLKTADRQLTLRHRIDLAVGAQQRGHQQGAAQQAIGVAKGADGDVDAAALAGEGGKGRGHHDGGDIFGIEARIRGLDTEPVQHRLQAFLGELSVLQRVAGVVEADHQPITDQHVVADAFDVDDVLDPRGGGGGGGRNDEDQGRRQGGDRSLAKRFFPRRLATRPDDGNSRHIHFLPIRFNALVIGAEPSSAGFFVANSMPRPLSGYLIEK